MPYPAIDCNSWHQCSTCDQDGLTCVNRTCQRLPFPRFFHRMSPESMSIRSTISVAAMKIRLNLVLDRSNTPQIRRLSTQVERHVTTPELSLNLYPNTPRNRHTVNASSKTEDPGSHRNGGNDPVMLPDRHTESAAID
jgi:hypothetical protein